MWRCNLNRLVIAFSSAALFCSSADADKLRRCLNFANYDGTAGTIGIKNSCPACRTARVKWCDGTTFRIGVPGSEIQQVQAFPGCAMQIDFDYRCAVRLPMNERARLGRRPVQNSTAGAARRVSLKSGSNTQFRALATRETAVADEPALQAKKAKNVETAATEISPATQTQTQSRIPASAALFAAISEVDWRQLEASESGRKLIKQADELLDRKAELQMTSGELWFSTEATKRQEEWSAAEKELQTINRKLDNLQDEMKAAMGCVPPCAK